MPKGNFWSDMSDQALEFGVSTAKATQNIPKALNPLQSVLEKNNSVKNSKSSSLEKMNSLNKKKDSTDLDLFGLNKIYAKQDKAKLEAMRNKLFKMVKNDELKAIAERKRDEEERIQNQSFEEQQKQNQLFSQQQTPADIPQGKIRRTIGAAHIAVAQKSHQEVKANKGSS